MIYIELLKFQMDGDCYLDGGAESLQIPCINVPTSTDVGSSIILHLSGRIKDVKFKEEKDDTEVEEMPIIDANLSLENDIKEWIDNESNDTAKECFRRLLKMVNLKNVEYSNDPSVVIYISY